MFYFHGNLLVTRVVTSLFPLCAVADWSFNLKTGRNGEKEESSSGKWIWRRYWKPSFPCFLPLSIFTSTSTFISISISSQFLPCLVPIRWETQNNSKNNQSVTETTQPQSQAHSFCCCLLSFILCTFKAFIGNITHRLYISYTKHENGKQHKVQLRYKLRTQYVMFQ